MAAHGLVDRLLEAVYQAVVSPQTTRKEEASVDDQQTVPGAEEGAQVSGPATPPADAVLTDEELRAQYEARFGGADVPPVTPGTEGLEARNTPDERHWLPDAGDIGYDGEDAVYVLARHDNDDGTTTFDVARFASIERGVTTTFAQQYAPAEDAG